MITSYLSFIFTRVRVRVWGITTVLLATSATLLAQTYYCWAYLPKQCQQASGCALPPPCNCYMSTACWTRGDCAQIITSPGWLYASGNSVQSCQYVASLRVLCVWVYTTRVFDCSSTDVDCAPVPCPSGSA